MNDVRFDLLVKELKSIKKSVTDINIEEVSKKFIENGGFDESQPIENNAREAIKFAAIGKANDKF